MIIASGGWLWMIMKMDYQSLVIMDHAVTLLSDIVDIYIFYWYGELWSLDVKQKDHHPIGM